MAEARGINGRNGFIPYPGLAECGDEFDVWATRMAAHDDASRTAQDPRTRTLEQHDAFLGAFGTGPADNLGRMEYMLAHGLEYRDAENGTRHLVWVQPSPVYRDAFDARQRRAAPMNAAANQRMLLKEMIAQMPNAPGKMFSRSDIIAIIRAEIARGATNTGLYNLLAIFENLE